jgi:hypothetical protein
LIDIPAIYSQAYAFAREVDFDNDGYVAYVEATDFLLSAANQ